MTAQISDQPQRPLSVLFGNKPGWNAFIAENLDQTRFRPTYATGPLSNHDLAAFDLICPLTIAEARLLWSCRERQTLAENHLIPSGDSLAMATNKVSFNRFLIDAGFADLVPPMGDDATFPAIVKPERGEFGQHCHVVHTPQERAAICADLNAAQIAHFTQTAIPGPLEYTTHYIALDGQVRFELTLVSDMATPLAVRGKTQQPVSVRQVPTPRPDILERVLARMTYTGTGCFNYKIHQGRLYLFEMNPRFGATLTHAINRYLDALHATLSTPDQPGRAV